jgi:heme/copper-type cytochrome/quinol oxidase subunit 2
VTILELVWTITPSLILMAIAFPSFKLLYLMDIQQIYINYLVGTYMLAAIPVKLLNSKSTALVPMV